MKSYNGIVNMENTCVAYGTFDGMHKGHLKVAQTVAVQAQANGLSAVIVSCPKEGMVLTTEEEKGYLLKDVGIDALMTCTSDEDIMEILSEKLGAKILVVGENHASIEEVKAKAEKAGMKVVVCETVKDGEEVITTELVKQAFKACDFEAVTELCGHPYIMMGEVVHGKALGRTVGMPTANLGVADYKLKPPSGAYATSVRVDDELFKAMTNIGKRPSVDRFDYVTIEAFILDFSRDIYGKEIILSVYKFVRGVQKFNNLEEVHKQVEKDIEAVRDTVRIV